MTIQRYPLLWPEGWPRSQDRKDAQFGKGERQYNGAGEKTYVKKVDLSTADAIKRVHYELERLGVKHIADDVVISTNLRLNMAGLPRGGQGEPPDPGAAVYWELNGTRRVMAIDRYRRVRDNLAAIAATLEAMRAIERHGGAQILERAFTGFDALPAPPDPWTVLGLKRGASRDEIEAAYRRLAKTTHPDAGGSVDDFLRLGNARDEALRQ